MISLPENFKTRIHNLYGQEGTDWLSTLPALRETLLGQWSLQKPQPIVQLSYNYLEYAHSPTHGPVVLKIGYPNPELTTEIKALGQYRGVEGAVRLLDFDLENGALLLERILPGHNLVTLEDDHQATRIAAQAMVALLQPVPEGSDFPTMKNWCQGFTRYQDCFGERNGPLPSALMRNAVGLMRELLASDEDQYLLHGDLHHFNLLLREDGSWVMIDPKGVIGELAFEVGPYLTNPTPDLTHQPELVKVLSHRLEILAEITKIDRQRLAAWSFCRAVLSAIWSVEEGEKDLGYWVEIAGILEKLIE